MLYTTIDVLRPARVTFPPDVNNVLIINYTVPQPHEFGHSTELFEERARSLRIDTDSLPLFTIAALAQSMSDRGFFNNVLFDHVSSNPGNYFFTPESPTDRNIAQLANKHNVEGIISLNRIMVNDIQAELYNQGNGTFVSFLEARYETQWSIHFPGKNQTIPLINRDTVYWESESYSRQRALNGLPDRRNALIDGAIITGQRAVNSFIPYWEKADRYLFTGSGKLLKAGVDSVYHRNWEGAIVQWEKLLNNKPGVLRRTRVAHNLAVAYEITGNLPEALRYSTLAYENAELLSHIEYRSFATIIDYRNLLQKRIAEEERIKNQLAE